MVEDKAAVRDEEPALSNDTNGAVVLTVGVTMGKEVVGYVQGERWSFSVGWEALKMSESKLMPKNSRGSTGPYDRGEEGGVVVRKSSKRWMTYRSL